VQSDLKKQTGEGERLATCNLQFEGRDRKELTAPQFERAKNDEDGKPVQSKESRMVRGIRE